MGEPVAKIGVVVRLPAVLHDLLHYSASSHIDRNATNRPGQCNAGQNTQYFEPQAAQPAGVWVILQRP
jgi:hypothetical protein